jgi:hypothetical protein
MSMTGVPSIASSGPVVRLIEHRLDVDDRRAVDRFERPDVQTRTVDACHRHAMQADRIGTIRRSRCEHAGDRIPRVVARAHFEHLAPPLVQPGEHQDVVARLDAVEPTEKLWKHLDRRVGRSFVSLTWRALALGQRRPYDANRLQLQLVCHVTDVTPGNARVT